MRTEGSLRLGRHSEADKLIGQVKELVEVHGRIPGFVLSEQAAHFQRLAAYQLSDGTLQFETNTHTLLLPANEVVRHPNQVLPPQWW